MLGAMKLWSVIRCDGRVKAARQLGAVGALVAMCALAASCSDTTGRDGVATLAGADVTSSPPSAASAPPTDPSPTGSNGPPIFIMESDGATHAVHTDGTITPIMHFPAGLTQDTLAYLHQYAVLPDSTR